MSDVNDMDVVPFRWNIRSRAELGELIDDSVELDRYFLDDIRQCAARIMQFADDGKLVFVGRSLDSIHDYLSGLLGQTEWRDKLVYLSISLYGEHIETLSHKDPKGFEAFKAHFTALGLDPLSVKNSTDKINLVDVVSSGGTFGELYAFYKRWAQSLHEDVPAVLRKLRFLGVVFRTKNSPHTDRWQQNVEWTKELSHQALKNISVERTFWYWIANYQAKMARSNRPMNWYWEPLKKSEHTEDTIKAIQFSYGLYQLAQTTEEKAEFKRLLQNDQAVKEGWLRSLLLKI
jgi:hypothetical protein